MNREDERVRIGEPERPTADCPPRERAIGVNSQEILDIARKIDEFVSFNKWSWCDMDKVYRILKTIHG